MDILSFLLLIIILGAVVVALKWFLSVLKLPVPEPVMTLIVLLAVIVILLALGARLPRF